MGTIYKPILFSTEMVQAILDGRKTQTRRICNYQRNEDGKYEITINDKIESLLDYNLECNDGNPFIKEKRNVGDILWVRETWKKSNEFGEPRYLYKSLWDSYKTGIDLSGWKPSIHMPKAAARIFLEVTNVRCERLKDISCQDCKAEGVTFTPSGIPDVDDILALESFMALWESINGKDSWKANPWVWVYEFKKIEKPTIWPQ